MKVYRKLLVLSFSLLLMFCSCLNQNHPSDKIDFYTLEYDPPKINGLQALPSVIRIERFSVAPIYNTNRIIYRDKSFKRGSYVYHRWRTNPGDLVTYFLGRDMKTSGLFKADLPHDSRFPFAYMVEGTVDEFLERDMEASWEAVLTVSITLIDEREPDISKRIIYQKTYQAREPCRKKTPRALAVAMSRAMSEVSEKFIKDTHSYLKDKK
jgi:cholesterol transport system auxiliary component